MLVEENWISLTDVRWPTEILTVTGKEGNAFQAPKLRSTTIIHMKTICIAIPKTDFYLLKHKQRHFWKIVHQKAKLSTSSIIFSLSQTSLDE